MIVSIKIILIEKYFKFHFSPKNKWLTTETFKCLVVIILALGTTTLKKIHITVIYLNSIYRITKYCSARGWLYKKVLGEEQHHEEKQE